MARWRARHRLAASAQSAQSARTDRGDSGRWGAYLTASVIAAAARRAICPAVSCIPISPPRPRRFPDSPALLHPLSLPRAGAVGPEKGSASGGRSCPRGVTALPRPSGTFGSQIGRRYVNSEDRGLAASTRDPADKRTRNSLDSILSSHFSRCISDNYFRMETIFLNGIMLKYSRVNFIFLK